MVERIQADHRRYKKKVKELLRKNLGKYIGTERMRVSKNGKTVSIDIPILSIPRFTYGQHQVGGVSSGDGEEGDPLYGDPDDGTGTGASGEGGLETLDKVEFECADIADLLIEELHLPKLKPSESGEITEKRVRYDSIYRTGPQSLRHARRTLREALKRSIATGNYQPGDPIVPRREDFRYKAPNIEDVPIASALIIDLMDVSGSMRKDEKDLVKNEVFWRDWILERLYAQALGSRYHGLKRRYVVHTDVAKEVSEEEFYDTQMTGGTLVSVGYKKVREMIAEEHAGGLENIYVFHYSDGEMLSEDKEASVRELQQILPAVNIFGYTQIGKDESFLTLLRREFQKAFNAGDLVASVIYPQDGTSIGEKVLASINEKLRQGR